ncbi:MAG TPA: hypothetical protein VMC07_00675 [Candidatus Omnitrophota bacterium]|nr:hypothetical protein [Candidatus Omnitrophota bacterium]
MPKEDCRIEVKKLSPYSFGILFYRGENDASLLDIIEATASDGHFSIDVRGKEHLEIVGNTIDNLTLRLYENALKKANDRLNKEYYGCGE